MNLARERRRFPRFTLNAGYAPIVVRRSADEAFGIEGVAYDVSEGGMRFELDEAIQPGTIVEVQLTLPAMHLTTDEPPKPVCVKANVVWIEDEEDPAPYKMACVFAGFATEADHRLLHAELSRGHYRAAA